MTGALDISIDRLQLTVESAAGHEHRLRPIVENAIVVLQEIAAQRLPSMVTGRKRSVGSVHVPAVAMDLQAIGDLEASRKLAESVWAALALQLKS